VGDDDVWVANGIDSSTVSLLDPATADEADNLDVGRAPSAVAVGFGSVWVANAGDGTVSRIDPANRSPFGIRVGGEPSAVAVGEGAVWVANGDAVLRIDPRTNEVTDRIEVGARASAVEVGHGIVWVTVQRPSGA
jgi:peptide/nickel transport system substrate-binding protein